MNINEAIEHLEIIIEKLGSDGEVGLLQEDLRWLLFALEVLEKTRSEQP